MFYFLYVDSHFLGCFTCVYIYIVFYVFTFYIWMYFLVCFTCFKIFYMSIGSVCAIYVDKDVCVVILMSCFSSHSFI